MAALLFGSLEVLLVVRRHWIAAAVAAYMAVLLLDRWRLHRRRFLRTREEFEWWRRAKLGIRQSPLDPCCLHLEETGSLHDEKRCTAGPVARLWVDHDYLESRWGELVAELGDLDREGEGD